MPDRSFLIHARPNTFVAFALSWALFIAGVGSYLHLANQRHLANPDERVTPTIAQMIAGMTTAALQAPDDAEMVPEDAPLSTRLTSSMLWTDTVATGRRFLTALLLLIPAVFLGLHMGLFPFVGVFFLRFILFFDKIVALSLLPVLFIAFGIDELSKVMLIVIGVAPTIILDTVNLTRGVPNEQVVKAFTLGAHDFDVAYRVVLRQVLPRVLNSIRLNLKAVMLFLFAGEMIASTDGLAYRIALLRRQMGMDVIIPYVLWVALLLFLIDQAMRYTNRALHPWFREA
jgi:NitT/TauT family transport system permease protein